MDGRLRKNIKGNISSVLWERKAYIKIIIKGINILIIHSIPYCNISISSLEDFSAVLLYRDFAINLERCSII